VEEPDFDLFNEESMPTCHYITGFLVLDLTFLMAEVVPLIDHWASNEDNWTSFDHEGICFEITSDSDAHILPMRNEK
jgi:hypothetical protein